MIDKKIKIKSCIRKYAITDRDLMNGGGQLVPKGTKVYISFASNWGFESGCQNVNVAAYQ